MSPTKGRAFREWSFAEDPGCPRLDAPAWDASLVTRHLLVRVQDVNPFFELRRAGQRVVQRTVLQIIEKDRLLLFRHVPADVNVGDELGDHVLPPLGVAVVILVELGGQAPLEAEVNLHLVQTDFPGFRYSQ